MFVSKHNRAFLLIWNLTSVPQNRPLSPSDICYEGFSGEFAEILEDPYSPTGWTFESTIGTPVLESEYSNPESEDSYLESEYFTPFMIGAPSTMPQISHDSSYHSRAYSTTNPSNLEDRFVYDWDDGEWKFAPILSRSQVESTNSLKTAKR